MFLGGGEDEDGVGWRLLECLQESIESRGREHVDFVNDEDLVLADLGRYANLVDEGSDVIDRVVGGSVQFMDVHRALLIECLAGFAFIAGFAILARIEAVDGLGEDARTCGLSDTTRTAEEIGVSEFSC